MTFWQWASRSANALSPYVPLLQTLAWLLLITAFAVIFKDALRSVVDAIRKRIERGSTVEAGPFKLGPDLQKMDDVREKTDSAPAADPSWEKDRDGVYHANRGIFLTHLLTPSDSRDQRFDIFIFLVRHKQNGFPDVKQAEFFLGKYWDNKVFTETPHDDTIGIRISAYGPFMCLCKVTFTDGQQITLNHYVGFEMGEMIEQMHRHVL